MKRLIRATEAADYLGLHRQTIENWAAKGVLKIKEIGKAHYVDGLLIEQIADFASDVNQSLKALEDIKAAYDAEYAEIRRARREMRDAWNKENEERRYKNLCVEGSRRSEFFKVVLGMLRLYGSISEREVSVLSRLLDGELLEDICDDYGLTRERVRQIAEKAIRHSRDLYELKEKIDSVSEFHTTIEAQKIVIRDLRSQLKQQEAMELLEQEASDEERRRKLIENDSVCRLLSSRLVEYNLTVRSLNCVKSADIETVGDLVKCNKIDLLKMRNFGKKSLTELDDFIEGLGLCWGMDVDRYYKERIELNM